MGLKQAVFNFEDHSRVRVAVVSDTHRQLDPRVAEAVARHDCVIHAGDIGGTDVLDQLCTKLDCCVAVRGNNDTRSKWPPADVRILEDLPETALLQLPGGHVVVVHGDRAGRPAKRHDHLRATFPEARLVVYGHSHRRVVDRKARPWVANPGAAGRSRTYGGPGLLSLTASENSWRIESIEFSRL